MADEDDPLAGFNPDEALGQMRELAGGEDNANEVVRLFTRVKVRAKAEELWQRAEADPEFAAELGEELASLRESGPYITYPGGMSKPEKCEVCGTLVIVVPEVPASARTEPEPALWESGQWRKHTPRRCKAMRRET
jgi:hypothetical protein